VIVAVVQVGEMDVSVAHRLVPVPVGVRFRGRAVVGVPVMRVVRVAVLVIERIVPVFVLVPLGKMQPETEAHQQAGENELQGQRLAEQDDGDGRSDEGA